MTKWTNEMLRKEALKYNSRVEFRKNNESAYLSAWNRDLLDEICGHMQFLHKNRTDEEIRQEALKCKTRVEFARKYNGSYYVATRRGILDEVCSHMPTPHYWTREELIEEALKYNTRGKFRKNSPGPYGKACKLGILDEICGHMLKSKVAPISNEELQRRSLLYSSRAEFIEQDASGYGIAKDKGILDEICSHMPPPNTLWTYEMLKEEALKYTNKVIFREESPSAYSTAKARKIIKDICSHMRQSVSIQEESLFNLIKEKYPKTQKFRDSKVEIADKPLIKGFDIDVYIPELRKGIEFDGKYWHSVEGLKRSRKNWPEEDLENYHKIKDGYFLSKGIRLFHIKEEDWKKDRKGCLRKVFEFLKS